MITLVVTLAVSIPALFSDDLVTALQQDPAAAWHGQWWRLVTPILIQGYGIGQFVFNLLGIALVGAVVERRYRAGNWLIIYLVAGVVSILVTSWLYPDAVDSGSSAAVAGLIGALMVALVIDRGRHRWQLGRSGMLGLLYGVFFSVYLACLAIAGPVAGSVAGTVTIPAFLLTGRLAGARVLQVAAPVIVLIATVVLLAVGDVHGIGLLTGMIISGALTQLRSIGRPGTTAGPERPDRPRR